MRLDLPGCCLKDCRYYFDGNCTKTYNGSKPWLYEECPFTKLVNENKRLEEENETLNGMIEEPCLICDKEM